jgi:hypothetical protein
LPQRLLVHPFIYHAPNALAFILPSTQNNNDPLNPIYLSPSSKHPKLNPIPNPHSPKLQSQYATLSINALPRSRYPKSKTTQNTETAHYLQYHPAFTLQVRV